MQIYNSVTKEKEEFTPINPGVVKMYVCGPTVYNHIHIGNARPLVFFDVVHRYLKMRGFKVEFVSNITDIDDKIIKQASEQNITEGQLTSQMIMEYKKISTQLNVLEYTAQPLVTEYIDDIIKFIEDLVDRDFAYVVDGDVYFKVSKISQYGKISQQKIDSLQAGSRVDVNNVKHEQQDFTLWKKTDVGVNWESRFSIGRPGWHTECVVMIRSLLGTKIDIHGGGQDLKFPHHENENAQNCACNGDLANIWMHNGFINVDDEKMSKSLNNFILAKDVIEKYSGNFLRLLLLQTNYRQPIVIKDDFLKNTQKILEKFQQVYDKINVKEYNQNNYNSHIQRANEILDNDFNTSNLISLMLELAKLELTDELSAFYIYSFEVLGLIFNSSLDNEIPKAVLELIELRNNAKSNKDFEMADKYRDQIKELGFEIKDTREGTKCQMI